MHFLVLQEWQNSIQKNAGLAFIELINEGKVMRQTSLLLLEPVFLRGAQLTQVVRFCAVSYLHQFSKITRIGSTKESL